MKNDKVSYTSISEFIDELKEILDKHGDLPVCVRGASPIWTDLLAYYYDGGFALQDVNDSANYISSRTWNPEKKYTEVTKGFPKCCVNLMTYDPFETQKLNGRSVREIDPESWTFLDEEELKERKIFDGQLIQYKYDDGQKKYKAFLESGEFAFGDCMFDARVNLTKLYQDKKNERL